MWYLIFIVGVYLLIAGSCALVHEGDIKDCFNPLKWVNVAQGFIYKWLMPPHVMEQIFIRFSSEKCQPCIEEGKCLYCKCDTIAKMYAINEVDKYVNEEGHVDPEWGKIIWNKKEYEEFREKYPVTIKITFDNDTI